MSIFLSVLSALALLLAARRFTVSEDTGHDIGALFLLLIGIQLLVAAGLVYRRQQEHTQEPPGLADKGEGVEKEKDQSGKQ